MARPSGLPQTTVQALCMTCTARLTAQNADPDVASAEVDARAQALGWLRLGARAGRPGPVDVCAECVSEVRA